MIVLLENVLAVAVGAALFVGGWWQGAAATRRERTPSGPNVEAVIRDALAAHLAMGYDEEQAQALIRESHATGMRKLGAWKAE